MKLHEKAKIIVDYINLYPDLFTPDEKLLIIDYLGCECYYFGIPDVVKQLYAKLGLIPDEHNIYKGFSNLVDGQFSVKDRSIIEVGSGLFPTLAAQISSMQDNGKIVVYDPKVSIYEEDTPKLKLVRSKFLRNTNIDDADLIIGLMPCEAADIIVDVALKKRIDFMVALCEGGSHQYDDDWPDTLLERAEKGIVKNDMGKLKIKYMKEYGDPYPVIYNERS